MNIIDAIHNPKLFQNCFKDLKTWECWLVLLKALFAIRMTKKEFALYRDCTGRDKPPVGEFGELWAIVGRR